MRHLLADRDFRRLFLGRLVTNAGDSLYYIAAMWLVWELTNDPVYSGIAGFLTMGPAAIRFLFGPLVDRWDLRRVLVVSQVVQAVLVLVVPLAAYTGHLTVWVVLVVMPLLALADQFVYPAQSAALPRIVDGDDLVDANSAFSFAYQGVDLVFNATAGIVVALVGAVSLYAVDSLTFLAAAGLFAGVAIPDADDAGGDAEPEGPAPAVPAEEATDAPDGVAVDGGEATDEATPDGDRVAADDVGAADAADDAAGDDSTGTAPDSDPSYLDELRAGLGVLRGTFLVFVLAGAAFVNVSAGAMMAALPAFSDAVGGAGAYGALMAAFALGNLGGAVVAGRVDHYPFGYLSVACFGFSGVFLLAAVATPWFPATVALFALSTVPIGASNVLLSALVQSSVPESTVGRVSSVVGSAATSALPLGTLAGGVVAGALGPAVAVGASGVFTLLLGAYWLGLPSLRTLPPVGDIETLDRAADA